MTYHLWQDMWSEKFYLCIDNKIELDYTDYIKTPYYKGLSENYNPSLFVKDYTNNYDNWWKQLTTGGVDI